MCGKSRTKVRFFAVQMHPAPRSNRSVASEHIRLANNVKGRKQLTKFQGLFDFPQQTATHREAFAIFQHDDVLALKHRLKFFDAVEINNGTSAHTEKCFWIELRCQGVKRLAQNVAFFPGMDTYVVAGRFNSVNLGSLDHDDFVASFNGKTREILGSWSNG